MAYNKRQKLQDNIEAIRIAFQLEKENRPATPAEYEALRKYSGFGGLKFILNPVYGVNVQDGSVWKPSDRPYLADTLRLHELLHSNSKDDKDYQAYVDSVKRSVNTAFYTPDKVIESISQVFAESGVAINSFLDPSSGNGKFLDAFLKDYPDMRSTAFEKDLLTGKILKALHPEAQVVVGGFETIPEHLLGIYDIATSNIPFGDTKVFDPTFGDGQVRRVASKTLHNYFFMKALDSVREGGFVAFITSRGFMDSPSNNVIREELMKNARLVGAFRLPDGMFSEEAGTEVGSDLVVLQKYTGYDMSLDPDSQAFCEVNNGIVDISGNDYRDISMNVHWWKSMMAPDSEAFVATKWEEGTDPYGKPTLVFTHDGGMDGIAKQLKKYLSRDLYSDYISYYNDHAPKAAVKVTEEKKAEQSRQEQPKTAPKKEVKAEAPVQLDLFSMWDEQKAQKASLEPRPFIGAVMEHWRDGVIVADGDQLGTLSGMPYQPTFTPLEYAPKDLQLMQQYVRVRDAYADLYATEAELKIEQSDLRQHLNAAYDRFVQSYGPLNSRKATSLIIADALGRDTLCIENAEGRAFVKSDIFSRPVSFNVHENDRVTNAVDALSASLNRNGGVDLQYMSSISDFTPEELKEQLGDRIYFNPLVGGYETSDRFLAGNVVEKYDRLTGWKGINKQQHKEIQCSLAALEAVIPTPIAFEDLDFNFGERWMPKEYFEDFASKFFGVDISIEYISDMDEFIIDTEDNTYNKPKITSEYAVVTESGDTIDGLQLLRHALYNTVPNIQRVIGYKSNGDPIKGADHERMQLAATKIDQIRDAFTEWINGHDDVWKKDLADMYNRKYNCFVRAKYDGSHQTFPGLDLKSLKEKKGIEDIYGSQKDAVWMILQNGGGICDHEVGTGKTLIMCMAAHEMKRLGMANKPVIIGMKANISEIAATYMAAYPGDRVLYAGPKDFKDREGFFNRMKNNDYDCIIMSHEQFTMIPQSMEIQQQVLIEELHALDEALEVYNRNHQVSGRMLSGLEKRKENLEASLNNLNYKLSQRSDDVVDFKTMGIDHILVDESQAFKNLAFTTRDSRVAGLGDPKGSQRARNLQYAIRTIQERTGRDLGATFLSGTTISNSLTELYLLFKYLRPEALAKQDIHSFDAWAAVFAKKSRDYEINVAGQVVMKERFRHFIKVPELAAFYNEITDYKTAADVGLERPDMNVQLVNIPPTPDHQDFSKRLLDFANSGDGSYIFREELSDSELQAKMLIVTGLGKKASLSPRLVNPDYQEGDDTKIGRAAKNISDYYWRFNEQKGTQFVFCDLSTPKKGEWNAYQELKDRLVSQYNIPEGEIGFIQEASTEKRKNEYVAKMNAGDIRIMFGSTTTLGTGVNAQQRAVAVHHLDLPWRPSDMEQRTGRAVRKGNEVARLYAGNKVDVFVYAVERSLDSYNFYLLQAKSDFIRQMKTGALGKRDFDQGGEDETNGMPFAEYVAITSGNTDLLDRAKLEKRILGLESERKAFNAEQRNLLVRLDYARKDFVSYQDTLSKLRIDEQRYNDVIRTDAVGNVVNALEVGGVTMSQEDMGRALQDHAKRLLIKDVEVGRIYGFPVFMRPQTPDEKSDRADAYKGNILYVQGELGYRYNNGHVNLSSRIAAATNPVDALQRIPVLVKDYEKRVAGLQEQIPELERITSKEWEKTALLADLKKQLTDLDRKIQHDMDDAVLKSSGQQEESFKIIHHSWGRQPWELQYKAESYPFVSREDMRELEEKYHGDFQWTKDNGLQTADFRHQYGAEAAFKDLSKLNAEHRYDLQWLVDAVKNVRDNTCLPAAARLRELGFDRFGHELDEDRVRSLSVVSLGSYADVRELAHNVKSGRNEIAIDVTAKGFAYALEKSGATAYKERYAIVSMPDHDGYSGAMGKVAEKLSQLTGIPYVDTLRSAEHDSIYNWKKAHPGEPLPELFFTLDRNGSELQGKSVILIDNVLDTGHTAKYALEAFEEEPTLLVLGHTENYYDAVGVDIQVEPVADGVEYLKNVTPAGIGYTGKTELEISALMRKALMDDNFNVYWDARRELTNHGMDYYSGYPLYLVHDIVDKWENAGEDEYMEPLTKLLASGGVDKLFTEQERQHLSQADMTRLQNSLLYFKDKLPHEYGYRDFYPRMALIVYDVLRQKVDQAMAAEQQEAQSAVIDNDIEGQEVQVTATVQPKIAVIPQCDLATDKMFIQNHSDVERVTLRYQMGESYEDYMQRNHLRSGDTDRLYYFHDKYTPGEWGALNIIFRDGITVDNAAEVAGNVAALECVTSKKEAAEVHNLLADMSVIESEAVLPYIDAVYAAYNQRITASPEMLRFNEAGYQAAKDVVEHSTDAYDTDALTVIYDMLHRAWYNREEVAYTVLAEDYGIDWMTGYKEQDVTIIYDKWFEHKAGQEVIDHATEVFSNGIRGMFTLSERNAISEKQFDLLDGYMGVMRKAITDGDVILCSMFLYNYEAVREMYGFDKNRLHYEANNRVFKGVPEGVFVYCNGEADRIGDIYGSTNNPFIDLVHDKNVGVTFARVWVEDRFAEQPGKIIAQLEQDGKDVGLHGERGSYVDFDTWQEAVAFELHVREIEHTLHPEERMVNYSKGALRPNGDYYEVGDHVVFNKAGKLRSGEITGWNGQEFTIRALAPDSDTEYMDYGVSPVYVVRMDAQEATKEVSLQPEIPTVIRRQYNDLKSKHPDALLLFRCGDFYESYEHDAVTVSKVLDISLTGRPASADFKTYKGVVTGFPYHALDTYLPKLIRAGYRVAICDQLEAPKQTVKRGITELVEPDLGIRMQIVDRHSSLTSVEKSLMSQIVTDLETGNHLLGRPRPEGYWEFAAEHSGAVLALKQGTTLTERQRNILLECANNLYKGLHDLAIDLNMDEEHLRDALSVGSVNEHRSIEEYPITNEGNYWFVGNTNGYGIMPQYAVQVATLYNGEQVDRDGRTMMRFASEDDAKNFVGNIRLLNDRYTNQLRDGIIEKMRSAGIAVNTDWKEGERVLTQENSKHREQVSTGYTQKEIEEKVGLRLTMNNYDDIRKINPFISFLWSDKVSEFIDYREVFKTPTLDDYYIATKANYEYVGSNLGMQSGGLVAVEHENQQKWNEMVASGKYEHQKSPLSASEYLLDKETGDIYRFSNHWGRVASCQWSIDKRYGTEDVEIYAIGKCNIQDFHPNYFQRKTVNPAYGAPYMDALQRTIENYNTLLHSNVEITDAVRKRIEERLTYYRSLKENFEAHGYRESCYSVRFNQDMEIPLSSVLSAGITEQMRQDVMVGQPRFFRNGEHMAYGFVHNGTIYIDPRVATAETPLHEYTHLWAEVLRQRNPQEWQNIVQMMKDTPEVWNYVKRSYPHLMTDVDIADEALAQFSGKRGYQKLQEFVNSQEDKTILDKMIEMLGKFWSHVADFFGIHYTNKEEVADRILYDLLNEVNPLDYKLADVEGFREAMERQTESDNFKQRFGDWQLEQLNKTIDVAQLQDEYNTILRELPRMSRDAEKAYDEFAFDMKHIYGEEWLEYLTPAEQEEEHNLSSYRDSLDLNDNDAHEVAFAILSERHGARFEELVSHSDGRIYQLFDIDKPDELCQTLTADTEEVRRDRQLVVSQDHAFAASQEVADKEALLRPVRVIGVSQRFKLLVTEAITSADNPHVGYSRTVTDGVNERGVEHIERNIFYNGKPIGVAFADIETGQGNPLRVLSPDTYRETVLLNVRVHDYDAAENRWEGVAGKELDGHYDYGCIRFDSEQEMIEFYEANKDDIDYRNGRYDQIEMLYLTKGRAAAEEYSKTASVQYLYKPVPPMREWVDINTDKDFQRRPQDEQERLRYVPGEKIEDYKRRNHLYAGHLDFAYYFFQKFADRQDEVKAILKDGLTDDNVKAVARQVAALVDSREEGFEVKSLLNYSNTVHHDQYYYAFEDAFKERQKVFADNPNVKVVQGLEGYSVEDIKKRVREHVEDILTEYFMDDDVTIKEVTVIGSRSRGEAHEGSDLDILLEYGGKGFHEDAMYNILHAMPMDIDGITVDIKPINAHYSMTTADWLARDARWREEDYLKQHNLQKTMNIKDDLQQLLQEVMPREGERYDFGAGFMADDTDHRAMKADLLVTSLKNSPNGFLAGEDSEGYLNISRLSADEQDFIHKLIREKQLAEMIGEGNTLRLDGAPLTFQQILGDSNSTVTIDGITVRNSQLELSGTVERELVGIEDVKLSNLSIATVEQLYATIRDRRTLAADQLEALSNQYKELFGKATWLKPRIDVSSPLYDELNSISQPTVAGEESFDLKGWGEALLEIAGLYPEAKSEAARFNAMTDGDYYHFAESVSKLTPEQSTLLVSNLIAERSAFTPAVLDDLYTSTIMYYNETVPRGDVQDGLVALLGATSGKTLMDWALGSVTYPGERLQQLKDALAHVSLYDADRLMNTVKQRNEQPERAADEARLAPKTLLEGHYAMVMSYYLINYQSLTTEQKSVFQRLDRAATSEDLSQWAGSILKASALDSLGTLPEVIKEEVSGLAYAIAETTDDPETVMNGLSEVGIVNDMRMELLAATDSRLMGAPQEGAILFKNGTGLTAVGASAEAVSEATGWPLNIVRYGDGQETKLIHISNDGFEVLAEQDMSLRVVNSPVTLRPFMDQPYAATGYALQTIDYNISFAKEKPVQVETDGSLNIGNFKAKTLDFHPTGLDAIAEDGEKMVIRDIPTNYYHPEGTLVVADYINGHRETIENAIAMAQPLDLGAYDSKDQMPTVYEDYNLQKQQHPDEILLLRQKGFVEAFGDDAKRFAEVFGLPLYERHIDNETVHFAMMDSRDYMEQSDEITIDVHVAVPEATDSRQAISQSLSRMQEQIAINVAKKGVAAEIFPSGEGKFSVRMVNADTLHQVSNAIELTPDEVARYKMMVGPAAMSERGDFVLEMADKYFGQVVRAAQQHEAQQGNAVLSDMDVLKAALDRSIPEEGQCLTLAAPMPFEDQYGQAWQVCAIVNYNGNYHVEDNEGNKIPYDIFGRYSDVLAAVEASLVPVIESVREQDIVFDTEKHPGQVEGHYTVAVNGQIECFEAVYDNTPDVRMDIVDNINKQIRAWNEQHIQKQQPVAELSKDGEIVTVTGADGQQESYTHVHGWTHDDPALFYTVTDIDVFFYDNKTKTVENIDNEAGIDAYEDRDGIFLVRSSEYEEAYRQLEKNDRAKEFAPAVEDKQDKYYAFGQEVPQEYIDELKAEGVTDFSTENLETLLHYEVQDNGVPTVKLEEREKPYTIHIGETPCPWGVEGEYHVNFGKTINAVSFDEIKAMAEEMGGSARIMDGQEWADFYCQDDAQRFADKVVALNADRIVEFREAARHEAEALKAVGYDDFKKSLSGPFQIPTVDYNLYFRYAAGLISLHEAAQEFTKHGQTSFVDEDYTRAQFERINKQLGKLDADLKQLAGQQIAAALSEAELDVFDKKVDKIIIESQLINEYPQLKTVTAMNEKNQEQVAEQQEAQAQQENQQEQQVPAGGENKKPFANIDYSMYSMPEGVNVENASIFKRTTGKNAGLYAIFAVINGERKTKTLTKADLNAFFDKSGGKRRAELDQLIAKYFGKSADSMAIGSVGEAEKVRNEQKVGQEQAADEKETKEQAQQVADQKKKEAEETAKKEKPSAAIIQSGLLVSALVAAGADNLVWLNKDGKKSPEFTKDGMVVSPFNALMMGLHSDANGYKTNVYTTFGDAHNAGYSVKKGESGLAYNWYAWNKYVNKFDANDVITKEAYEALSDDKKDLYKVQRNKEEKSIFNVDQTTMSSVKKDEYKALLAAQDKSIVGRGVKETLDAPEEGKTIIDTIKEQNPDKLLLLRTGNDTYELHGADAEKAAKLLGAKITEHPDIKDENGKGVAVVRIHVKNIDRVLPKLVRAEVGIAISDKPESETVIRRYGTADKIYDNIKRLTDALSKSEGDKVMFSSIHETGYDVASGILHINDLRTSAPGEEVKIALARANDVYRSVVAYTGAPERLNRGGRMLPEDMVKYDKLVQELSAGVLMARKGLPASISPANKGLIPYWERELKEDPKLVARLENDVNNAVKVVSHLSKGEAVDYAAMRGEKNIEAMRPKFYTIASMLNEQPDMESKKVVIIRDLEAKSAAVILPAGASLEVNNEVPGMSKARIATALKKEGIDADHIQFYNAGGSLGLHQPNEFFNGKDVQVVHLKQYELVIDETLDLKEEIARTSKLELEQVLPIRDDNGHYVLYVKPTDAPAITANMTREDINLYFSTMKGNPERFEKVKDALGQKYYAFVQKYPEQEAGVLMPEIDESINLQRITEVNIAKDKFNNEQNILSAIIDGEKVHVNITKDQANRMLLVEDKDDYKLRLAAVLFGEKLGIAEGLDAAQFRGNNEGQGDTPIEEATHQEKVKQEERHEEQRGGGFHR